MDAVSDDKQNEGPGNAVPDNTNTVSMKPIFTASDLLIEPDQMSVEEAVNFDRDLYSNELLA